MTSKLYLSLAFHNHQPVGNFGWVFREAFDVSYLPMVECLERHPAIKVALHYTGPLRDWILENEPDFFPRIGQLVDRGQVEIMTGAYYEPVLASLNDADKLGQIRKQTNSIKADFKYDATGLWLAERVWEPHLPRSLAQAGVKYTIVDDTHFKAVGYKDEDLLGYYVTEEQGHLLKVFATSMPLRYSIPWSPVEEVIDWLKQQHELDIPLYLGRVKTAVMGDDGEKFGMWPGTHKHVWEEGWMDRFFDAVEENKEWLETITPGAFASQHLSLGRIYLPTSSYDEMGEWVMPPDEAQELSHLKHDLKDQGKDHIVKYMRGGLWRQFMVKYPEVNQLHKKALWVSNKVHGMPDGPDKDQALEHLWASQCNCGYWHGVFGGIYLFHIRVADYEHMIAAENLVDDIENNRFTRVDIVDFDHDGMDDVVMTTDRHSLVFDADKGGGMVEWDFRAARYNLLNVMSRYKEGYHTDLIKAAEEGKVVTPETEINNNTDEVENIHSETVRAREPNLHEKLIYDWHRRTSFLDHFLHESATLDGVYRSQYREQGDFVNQPYQFEIIEDADRVSAVFQREGQVWQGAVSLPVTIKKHVLVAAGSNIIMVTYTVTNGDGGELNTRFGIETNWGLAGGEQENAYLRTGFGRYSLQEISENDEIDEITITSELWKIDINIDIDQPATMWRFPLEAISASEGGFERNYQGTSIMLWWPLKLQPGSSWQVTFKVGAKPL